MVVKILCLHGGSTNGKFLKFQLSRLAEFLGDEIQLDFIDAVVPWRHPVEPAFARAFPNESEHFGWFHFENADASVGKKVIFEVSNELRWTGHERSLAQLDSVIETHGPYNAILGFSQGSIMATLLVARAVVRNKPIPFNLVILFNNIAIRDHSVRRQFKLDGAPLPVKSVIVRGTSDHFYTYGKDLDRHFSVNRQQVIEHTEGHRVPKSEEVLQSIAESIRAGLDLPRIRAPVQQRPPMFDGYGNVLDEGRSIRVMPASSRFLPPLGKM